jgi:hypothetical protein
MRHHDWPKRLEAYLNKRKEMGFSWGVNDCCAFAFGAAVAMGLPDPTPDEAKNYRSANGAERVIRRLGGTLEKSFEIAMSKAGFREIPPLTAQRGDVTLTDIVTVDGAPSPAFGIVDLDGRKALFVKQEGGLSAIPMKSCRRAWRVE